MLLRLHGIGADAEQVRHRFATGTAIGIADMLRCAKALGLKARCLTSDWGRLARTPLPALAARRNGGFFILAKVTDGRALIQDPLEGRPLVVGRGDLEAQWDGRLVLFARRASLPELARRFDVTWFLQAMVKYRRVLGEVLIASLFLQILALISPLFFQVVIDKVLVHRALTTLDVLVIGLVTVSIFEAVLGGLRTYVFAHTTNRIDVELGTRLFRHLVALPLAYFEARRVGDSVARVRELREHPHVSDRLGADPRDRPGVHGRVSGGNALLLAAPDRGRDRGLPLLHRAVGRVDARFPASARREVRARRREPGVPGRSRDRHRDAEGDGGRAPDAAALGGAARGYVRASFRVANLGNVASQSVQLISKLVTATILYAGARLVIEGGLSVGELVAFNMLASRVTQPVLRLAQIWQDFHQARLSVARLGDILNTHPEPAHSPTRAALPPIRGEVVFERVIFRYRADSPVVSA